MAELELSIPCLHWTYVGQVSDTHDVLILAKQIWRTSAILEEMPRVNSHGSRVDDSSSEEEAGLADTAEVTSKYDSDHATWGLPHACHS